MSQKVDFETARIDGAAVVSLPASVTETQTPQYLDRYELRRPLSKGGFATVYEGFDPRIKRAVAIKKCSSLDEDNHERFFREAEIAGNLSHPNIVRIFDFGVADGIPFIIQELLGGRDLSDWIESGLELSTHDRVQILLQIARGLAYAHSRGVIHRDIKPANVRVLEDGAIKLMDFGVAAVQQAPSDLTQAGTTVGTAAYLAPEQIHGNRPSRTTDMFSYGVLAYELLSGHRPFEGETLSAVLYQIAHQQPEALRAGAIPGRLVRLVHQCLEKAPNKRPATFDELVDELEAILRDPRLAPPSAETVPIGTYPRGLPTSYRPAAATTDSSATPVPESGRPAQLSEVPLAGPRPAVRDSSTRIQVARRPRRGRRFLFVLLLLLVAASSYLILDGSLPEPVAAAVSDVEGRLPERAQSWLALFREPESPPPPMGVRPADDPAWISKPSDPAEPAPKNAVEPAKDPVTAVAAILDGAGSTPDQASEPAARIETPRRRRVSPNAPATVFLPPSWHPEMLVSIDGGAYLSLDRRRTRQLPPGSHRLAFWLNASSYEARRTLDVNLEPAETRTIESPLAPPAALSVRFEPAGLSGRLEIDGESLAIPLEGPRILEPGSHRITLHPSPADPLGPLTKTVDLRSATAHAVTFDLRRRRAELEYGSAFDWNG